MDNAWCKEVKMTSTERELHSSPRFPGSRPVGAHVLTRELNPPRTKIEAICMVRSDGNFSRSCLCLGNYRLTLVGLFSSTIL